jgi:hypothetical protein
MPDNGQFICQFLPPELRVAPPPELLRVLPPPPEGAGVLLLPEEPES